MHPARGKRRSPAIHLHLELVVVALAVAGWLAVGIPVEMRSGNRGRDLRSLLWFVAGALLALLFWREPRGLTPPLLLGAELVGCAWLARRKPDVVFAPLALMLTGIILVRVVGLDIDRSRSAAVSLLNAPLGARVLVCAAIALAGVLLKTEGLGRLERTTGQVLQATAGVMLLVVLSTGWVMHQDVPGVVSGSLHAGLRLCGVGHGLNPSMPGMPGLS